ncbi:hypothetical protein BY996DRAFT_6771819 [Phakopsora pachyrhizi]|uniref:Expressed protein n=1 Tax=Phakopsora pachyrhizi TaxID=170000 RepID=A0AAV0BQM3_PHAPC|nr:hypothetical protein BY996DRAFT_6771819 [Phakopsora pachyrhizi]CAH7689664.1 expressed protein [Phakopsora pachyrhizi]
MMKFVLETVEIKRGFIYFSGHIIIFVTLFGKILQCGFKHISQRRYKLCESLRSKKGPRRQGGGIRCLFFNFIRRCIALSLLHTPFTTQKSGGGIAGEQGRGKMCESCTCREAEHVRANPKMSLSLRSKKNWNKLQSFLFRGLLSSLVLLLSRRGPRLRVGLGFHLLSQNPIGFIYG